MGLFQHFVCICSINFFLSICLYIFRDLFKVILHLSFLIALWDIYYVHLVWKDIENDLNRITDFLINLWDFFQISFLNFINVLAMVFDNLSWRHLIWLMKQRVKKSDSKMHYILQMYNDDDDLELNCKYIYII